MQLRHRVPPEVLQAQGNFKFARWQVWRLWALHVLSAMAETLLAADENPLQTRSSTSVQGAADANMQKAITASRATEYTTFGAVVLVLNLIPVLNYVLNFGNAAGAALWAADMEVHLQLLHVWLCFASH